VLASLRIGGYVVPHNPAQLEIDPMWTETSADQSCCLTYDVRSGEPDEMRIAVQRSPTVLFITFNSDLAHSLKDARACLTTSCSWGRRFLTVCLTIGRRCCLEKPGEGLSSRKDNPEERRL
jgi:hypothetical protein